LGTIPVYLAPAESTHRRWQESRVPIGVFLDRKLNLKEVRMSRWPRNLFVTCLALGCALFAQGCSDDDDESNMVIVTGVVRNVDNGARVAGARVTLLDTEFTTDVPTGADGAFRLEVPRGSRLILHTDDFNPAEDIWFPLLNVDNPDIIADDHIEGLAIHTCPHTTAPQLGSVAVWDNYLQNGDEANGDMFEVERAIDAGGIVSILTFDSRDGAYSPLPMRLELMSRDYPVGYVDGSKVWPPGSGTPDPSLGPHIIHPPDFPGSSDVFFSFAPSGSSVRALAVSLNDVEGLLTTQFPAMHTIPVRPGTITLGLWCAIEGVGGKSFTEWGNETNWFGRPEAYRIRPW
jgi:hypothetical protein